MYPGRLDEILDAERQRIQAIRRYEQGNPSFLPIFITGGVGDGILLRTTLNVLKKDFQLVVYSNHAEALNYFYKDTPVLRGELPDFTWCLHLDSVAKFKFKNQFAGFQLPEHRELFERQQELFRRRPDLEYLLGRHPQYKALLTEKAAELELNATTMPLYCLGYGKVDTIAPWRRKPHKKYITIHDGFDVNNRTHVTARCTKVWDWTYWNSLVMRLHGNYPGYDIIQLGASTSRPIDGVDQNLINKTTFHQAFDLISEAALHIDTDSGLAHAATTMSVAAVVIFGPSPKEFYGHAANTNLFSTKSCRGGCFHLGENWTVGWMDKCPIGYPSPQCLDDVTPDVVFAACGSILDAQT